jgi:hypothetical protein
MNQLHVIARGPKSRNWTVERHTRGVAVLRVETLGPHQPAEAVALAAAYEMAASAQTGAEIVIHGPELLADLKARLARWSKEILRAAPPEDKGAWADVRDIQHAAQVRCIRVRAATEEEAAETIRFGEGQDDGMPTAGRAAACYGLGRRPMRLGRPDGEPHGASANEAGREKRLEGLLEECVSIISNTQMPWMPSVRDLADRVRRELR